VIWDRVDSTWIRRLLREWRSLRDMGLEGERRRGGWRESVHFFSCCWGVDASCDGVAFCAAPAGCASVAFEL